LKERLRKLQARADIPGSCWALDLGTSVVRAAALRSPGRLIEIRQVPIPRESPGDAPREVVLEALRELVAPRPPRGEIVVTSLPLHQVFLRSLEMPFNRVGLIEQVIASEAELHIPFPLDQVVIDFWPQEELPEGKTRVMMAAVRKDYLSAHLELLAEAGIDPAVVGLDLTGLALACARAGQIPREGSAVLLEIGAAHTAVACLRDGRLAALRGFTWGGDSVTAGIAKELSCSFPEAESLKLAVNAADPRETRAVTRAAETVLAKLDSELRRTLHSATEALGESPIQVALLAGGGAQLPGCAETVERALGCPPVPADPWPGLKGKIPPDLGAVQAVGTGLLALSPVARRVSFRREEFTFAGSWTAVRKRLFISLGLVVGLLVLFTLALEVRISRRESDLGAVGKRIREILEQTFPAAAGIRSGSEVAAMEKGLNKMREDFDYYRDFASLSGLDVIRELSRVIPGEVPIQVVELSIRQEKVRLRGRTDTYRSADIIKNSIQGSPFFDGEGIKENPRKTRKVGGKTVTVEFTYSIPLSGQRLER